MTERSEREPFDGADAPKASFIEEGGSAQPRQREPVQSVPAYRRTFARFFTSPSPDPNYAAAGDLLRVVSLFMIAWYHIWQQSWLNPAGCFGPLVIDLANPVRAGYMFVDLLLMLSGFVTYLPYANDRARPAGEFYRRRALRILPSYYLCLGVMLVLAVASPDYADGRTLFRDLLAHLGFVHNLWHFSYHATRLNNVLWTLSVEVQFYLILPALAPVFRKRPALTYAALTAAGLSFMFLWTRGMEDTTLYVNRLPNMLVVYMNGMLAAHLYARLARVKRWRGLIALIGTLLCVAAVWGMRRILNAQAYISGFESVRKGQLDHRWLFSACGAAFLLGGSLSFAPVRAACSNRLTRFLAGISLNFYIWHQWIAVRLKVWRIPPYLAAENPNMVGEMPWQMQYTLLCFAVALAVAVILTYAVEKPCARWGGRMKPSP